MNPRNLQRLSIVLFGGALLLLLLSFVPRPATQPELPEATADVQPQASTTDLSSDELAAEGAALFQAKGCPTCHRHDAIENPDFSTQIGPNLTHYQPDPDFVRQWLRNPPAIRPNTAMPNLHLSEEEIDALIAFLASEDNK